MTSPLPPSLGQYSIGVLQSNTKVLSDKRLSVGSIWISLGVIVPVGSWHKSDDSLTSHVTRHTWHNIVICPPHLCLLFLSRKPKHFSSWLLFWSRAAHVGLSISEELLLVNKVSRRAASRTHFLLLSRWLQLRNWITSYLHLLNLISIWGEQDGQAGQLYFN